MSIMHENIDLDPTRHPTLITMDYGFLGGQEKQDGPGEWKIYGN
jgi:hypothetical protein